MPDSDPLLKLDSMEPQNLSNAGRRIMANPERVQKWLETATTLIEDPDGEGPMRSSFMKDAVHTFHDMDSFYYWSIVERARPGYSFFFCPSAAWLAYLLEDWPIEEADRIRFSPLHHYLWEYHCPGKTEHGQEFVELVYGPELSAELFP